MDNTLNDYPCLSGTWPRIDYQRLSYVFNRPFLMVVKFHLKRDFPDDAPVRLELCLKVKFAVQWISLAVIKVQCQNIFPDEIIQVALYNLKSPFLVGGIKIF